MEKLRAPLESRILIFCKRGCFHQEKFKNVAFFCFTIEQKVTDSNVAHTRKTQILPQCIPDPHGGKIKKKKRKELISTLAG